MKQFIVVDFDDVIAQTMVDGFLPNLNVHQRSYLPEAREWISTDFTRWDAGETTGFSDETIQTLFDAVDYKHVGDVKDAVETIRELTELGNGVQIVTANPNEDAIRQWMDRHGLNFYPLTSTPDKIAFMEQRGYTVIVDDNPDTLRAAASRGFDAIRFTKPWNKILSSPKGDGTVLTFAWGSWNNEYTAGSWYDVWKIVKELSKSATEKAVEQVTLSLSDSMERVEKDLARALEDNVIANANGALQTDLKARFDLLPALAIARVAQVLHNGAEKYGKDNWRGLSVEECHNHTIGHAIGFNNSEDLEDLAHTATRALMTLEIALAEWVTDGTD